MSNEKFRKFAIETLALLKERALEAKNDVDNPKGSLEEYYKGIIMGFYSIITLFKHQAFAFCVDQKELGLADIQPEVHLLGLLRNPDIDHGEDNWSIDVTNEELVKGYLANTIFLLKEQATEAKKEADKPKEGYVDYSKGELEAYSFALSILKNQAEAFSICQEDIGLVPLDKI